MNPTQAVEALAALAHESRLAVFRRLVQFAPEGCCPSELTSALDIPPALLSFHLKALLHAGMVQAEQQGRSIRYRANIDRTQSLAAYLLEHCCSGEDTQRCAPGGVPPSGCSS